MRTTRWLLAAVASVLPCVTLCAQEGQWSFVDSPNPTSFLNAFHGIDATSPDDIWAVGEKRVGLTADTESLVLHWDGSAWGVVGTPANPAFADTWLRDVAAIDGDAAWAVGVLTLGSDASPWVLRWNGDAWSQASTSGLPASSSLFSAVAVDGAVWVAGRGPFSNSIAARWNGSGWTSESVEQVGTYADVLFHVDASAVDDIWAVGSWTHTYGGTNGLASHWNGSTWESQAVAPPPGGSSSTLRAVRVFGPDDAWAVGDYYEAPGGTRSWIAHWNGASWVNESLPAIGDLSALRGIHGTPSDLWAVGVWQIAGVQDQLLYHYDGASWSQVAAPTVPGSGESVRAVVGLPNGDFWLAGTFSNGTYAAT
ncbi:MAG: hypothetical protein KDC38_10480, partial [Planctomycetes bacterium]|nr:hypothetical protein [Planctomycetota bacterium]